MGGGEDGNMRRGGKRGFQRRAGKTRESRMETRAWSEEEEDGRRVDREEDKICAGG